MALFNKDQFKTWIERSHPDFREHLQAIGKKCGYSDLAIHTGNAGKKLDNNMRRQYHSPERTNYVWNIISD